MDQLISATLRQMCFRFALLSFFFILNHVNTEKWKNLVLELKFRE